MLARPRTRSRSDRKPARGSLHAISITLVAVWRDRALSAHFWVPSFTALGAGDARPNRGSHLLLPPVLRTDERARAKATCDVARIAALTRLAGARSVTAALSLGHNSWYVRAVPHAARRFEWATPGRTLPSPQTTLSSMPFREIARS